MVESLNDPAGAMAKMHQGGMTANHARGMLDRMVEVQASTNGVLFVIAAAVAWMAPKPDRTLETGAGH